MIKILFQLIIVMFFLISNGYQSLVTSFMLDPIKENFLKSIDEFLESHLKLLLVVEHNRSNHQQKLSYYYTIFDSQKIVLSPRNLGWNEVREIGLDFARIEPCKYSKNLIDVFGDGKRYEGFYLIPEVFETRQINLFTPPLHPYLDEVRKFILKIIFLKRNLSFKVSENYGLDI